ncbi:MAG: hypothetical protein QM744_02745 [Mesorhizobium sp.]
MEEMSKLPKHLVKRGRMFYHRVWVPADLRNFYPAESFMRSLKTDDEQTARIEFHKSEQAILEEFREARARRDGVGRPVDIEEVAKRYRKEVEETLLTARIRLFTELTTHPKRFWARKDLPRGTEDYTFWDRLKEGDAAPDQIAGYAVKQRSKERVAELRRMIATGAMPEFEALARKKMPGLDAVINTALAIALVRSELAVLEQSIGIEPDGKNSSDSVSRDLSQFAAKVSLDQLWDKWRVAEKPTVTTLATWKGCWRVFKDAVAEKADDAGSITKGDIIKFRDTLRSQGKAPKTINNGYFSCLNAIFAKAYKDGAISKNPCLGVDRVKGASTKYLAYSNTDMMNLLELAKGQVLDGTHKASSRRWVVWLMAATGSRIHEIVQI